MPSNCAVESTCGVCGIDDLDSAAVPVSFEHVASGTLAVSFKDFKLTVFVSSFADCRLFSSKYSLATSLGPPGMAQMALQH